MNGSSSLQEPDHLRHPMRASASLAESESPFMRADRKSLGRQAPPMPRGWQKCREERAQRLRPRSEDVVTGRGCARDRRRVELWRIAA